MKSVNNESGVKTSGRKHTPTPTPPPPSQAIRALPTVHGLTLTPEAFEYVAERSRRYQSGLPTGVPTPFDALNRILGGGFQPGQVYVLGAAPGCGKSSLAMRMCVEQSMSDGRALYVSCEVSPGACVMRTLADLSSTTLDALLEGRCDARSIEQQYMTALSQATRGISFVDATASDPNIAEMTVTAENILNCDAYKRLLVIDYLQLAARKAIKDDKEKDFRQRVATFSNYLAQVARHLNIPILALSSLNRANYDNGKALSAFKEAGDVESDADVVMLLAPAKGDEWEKIRQLDIWRLELAVLKNRHGKTGTVSLEFDRPYQRFAQK